MPSVMAPLLVSLPCAALAAAGASSQACSRQADESRQRGGVPACGGVSDDPSSLLQYRSTIADAAQAASRLISPLGALASEACPAHNDVLESWVSLGLRIFVFDAASLGPVARELFGGAAWWDTYGAWAADPSSFPLSNYSNGDPESPAAFVQVGFRPALEARSPQIEIVGSPEDADLVLWNVWDVALCAASGHRVADWELSKGYQAQSCDAHIALLSWLRETPRWRRNHGRDHVLFVDFPDVLESYGKYERGAARRDLRAIRRITRNAIMIGLEDARPAGRRGGSAFVAVPYFANVSKYQALATQSRDHLVGLAASSALVPKSRCGSCEAAAVKNTELRTRIFNDLDSGCAADECEVHDLTKLSNFAGPQRSNMTFLDRVDFGHVVHSSVFCPIPRGDSWSSKRLFTAILGGCIPVLLSDAMPLPFAQAVDLRGAMLWVPEAQMMRPDFSLAAFLRSQPPRKIAAMQARLECIKGLLQFRPECASSAEPGACSGSAMDFLVASLVRLAHHPREIFDVTPSQYWRSDPVP